MSVAKSTAPGRARTRASVVIAAAIIFVGSSLAAYGWFQRSLLGDENDRLHAQVGKVRGSYNFIKYQQVPRDGAVVSSLEWQLNKASREANDVAERRSFYLNLFYAGLVSYRSAASPGTSSTRTKCVRGGF